MSILCATDFSFRAEEAADVAVLLARKLSLPLRLIHCVEDHLIMGDLPLAVDLPAETGVSGQLRAEAARLREGGVVVIEELRHGSVVWELVEAAREQPTELLVLGSTGKGNAERWFIGSVAEAVAEETPVPCLVVRRPEVLQEWLHHRLTLEVLCAVDPGGSSDAAISWLSTFSAMGPIKIGAVCVMGAQGREGFADSRQTFERDVWEKVRAVLGEVPLDVYVREPGGSPAQNFLALAQDRNPGLMMVGCHHRHGLGRLGMRSFSHRVLAHAASNVLRVPAVHKTPHDIPHIRRILLATDLGAPGVETLRHACGLLPNGGEIHLLHVAEEPVPSLRSATALDALVDLKAAAAKVREEAEQQLKALARALPTDAAGVKISPEVIMSHDVPAAICEAAERMPADVICMGTKGHSRLGAAVLGSTVVAVTARVHLPVFVIPAPRP